MRLLHPYMPFISEEIWQHLPHEGESVAVAAWPVSDGRFLNQTVEDEMAVLMDLVRAVRNVRAEMNVEPSRLVTAVLQGDPAKCATVARDGELLKLLAGISDLEVRPGDTEKPQNAAVAIVPGLELYMPLAGLIDMEEETLRLEKELARIDEEIARLDQKLENGSFVARAPAEIVERERERRRACTEQRAAVTKRLQQLRAI
jgi:valyl-tRNA synthetase